MCIQFIELLGGNRIHHRGPLLRIFELVLILQSEVQDLMYMLADEVDEHQYHYVSEKAQLNMSDFTGPSGLHTTVPDFEI